MLLFIAYYAFLLYSKYSTCTDQIEKKCIPKCKLLYLWLTYLYVID